MLIMCYRWNCFPESCRHDQELVRNHSHWAPFWPKSRTAAWSACGRSNAIPIRHRSSRRCRMGSFQDTDRAADSCARAGSNMARIPGGAAAANRSCRCHGSARSISWPANCRASNGTMAMPPSWPARRAGARPESFTKRAANCAASWRLFGGFVDQTSNYSFGTALVFLPHVLGSAQAVTGPLTSWSSVARHAKLMVLFGGANPKNMQVPKAAAAAHAIGHSLAGACARRRQGHQHQSDP